MWLATLVVGKHPSVLRALGKSNSIAFTPLPAHRLPLQARLATLVVGQASQPCSKRSVCPLPSQPARCGSLVAGTRLRRTLMQRLSSCWKRQQLRGSRNRSRSLVSRGRPPLRHTFCVLYSLGVMPCTLRFLCTYLLSNVLIWWMDA